MSIDNDERNERCRDVNDSCARATLRCPECGGLHILGHDEWSAIVCLGCKVEIHKSEEGDIRASK